MEMKRNESLFPDRLAKVCEEDHQRQRMDMQRTQNTVLIWLDHDIDQNENDSETMIEVLRHGIHNIHRFTDVDQCLAFLQTIVDQRVCMIMPGFLGEYIVPDVHEMSQVDSIFIFCRHCERHERWIQHWPKIKAISNNIHSLALTLKQVAHQCEQNVTPLSFLRAKKNLNELDPSFMYTMILKDILINMEFDDQYRKAYANYCRTIFADNKEELSNVDRFEHHYETHPPIWWYTYQCFLYPMLNRALRLMDGDIIIRMGFFIADLHRHIDELHREQFIAQYNQPSFVVYRGQGLPKSDFERMSNSLGGLISFNNFLSTSQRREISLSFAQQAIINPDLFGILFTMKIDPNQSTTPFAAIREVSQFKMEDEVLFSMNTVFRVNEIHPIDEKRRLYEVMLVLTNDDDEELCELTYNIRDEIPSCTNGWQPLGLVLEKMGQYTKAEEVYHFVLEQETYSLTRASLYHALGRIKYKLANYQAAKELHEKVIDIYQQNFSPNSLNFFDIYNDMGLACAAMGENSAALSYFEKAVALQKNSLAPDHSNLADPYNHIGHVYYNIGDYSTALSFYERTLALRLQSLPTHHPNLAQCYDNIGLTYEQMNDHFKAHSYFVSATEGGEHSLPTNHADLLKYRMHLEQSKMNLMKGN